jgi:tyrosine-protein kinase Etk/Wzc
MNRQLAPGTSGFVEFNPAPAGGGWERHRMRDVLGILRRNRWLILAAGVLVAGAAAYFTTRLVPIYSASASVRIDDAPAGASSMAAMGLTGGSELSTELEMLRSRTLAEAVVDSLRLQLALASPARVARDRVIAEASVARDAPAGLYRLERGAAGLVLRDSAGAVTHAGADGAFSAPGFRFRPAAGAARHLPAEIRVQPFADAVDGLQTDLKVSRRGRDARVVDVAYESPDARIASEVPNVLVSRFIADRQSVQRSQARTTVAFLREQIGNLSGQLTSAEGALRSFREGQRVISIPDQASSEVRRSAELQAELGSLRAESSSLATLLAEVQASAANTAPGSPSPYRDLVAFPTLLRNQTAAGLLSSIGAAEDRRAELLTRRDPEDSDVKVVTTRIRQLESQLQSVAQTYLAGLNNQSASLQQTLAATGREMDALPAKEARFAQLRRDATVLEQIYTQLQSRLKEAEIAAAVEDPSVRLVDAAVVPRKPVRPDPLVNVGLALMAGLLLGGSLAFAREYADRSVHTRNDVLLATGMPVLGFVPRADRKVLRAVQASGGVRRRLTGGKRMLPAGEQPRPHVLVNAMDPWAPFAEAYNRLETNVAFATAGKGTKLIVVTSPLPGDGKTTSAVNFAITLAQRGQRVLLVDADLRRGTVHAVFQQPRAPGLVEVLQGSVLLRDAIRSVPVGGDMALEVVTAGSLPGSPAQLLRSRRMEALLEHLRGVYDVVILDAPPLNLVTDAALLGAASDGVIVVARSGVTTSEALGFTMEQLRNVNATVLGAVLNDIDFERDRAYDESYRYYAHYEAYGMRG